MRTLNQKMNNETRKTLLSSFHTRSFYISGGWGMSKSEKRKK